MCRCCTSSSQRTWPTAAAAEVGKPLKETLLSRVGTVWFSPAAAQDMWDWKSSMDPVEESPAQPPLGSRATDTAGARAPPLGQPRQTPRAGQTATFPPHTPTAVHHCRHIPCASGLCAWLRVTDVTTTSKSCEVQLGAGAGICSAGIPHSLLVPWSPWGWGVFALI